MSTPKAASCAAALFCLLLATAAWLDLGNTEHRTRLAAMARESRPAASAPGPLGSGVAARGRIPGAARGPMRETPPDPLTGEALVRAHSRSTSSALYDPGFPITAALEVWTGLPEEEWSRLLAEVDASPAPAKARYETAALLLSVSAAGNPEWTAKESLRRQNPPAMAQAVRKWTEADPAAAWRWIRENVEAGRMTRLGAGERADSESLAREAFAQVMIADEFSRKGTTARLLLSSAEAADRRMLLADCAEELAVNEAALVPAFLSAQADAATARAILTEILPSFLRESSSPADAAEPLLKLVSAPAFPRGSLGTVLREGLGRVPAERLWDATFAMAEAADPGTRKEDLVWLAENFAAKNPAANPPPAAGLEEMAGVMEETARALEQTGNRELADWYRVRIPSGIPAGEPRTEEP